MEEDGGGIGNFDPLNNSPPPSPSEMAASDDEADVAKAKAAKANATEAEKDQSKTEEVSIFFPKLQFTYLLIDLLLFKGITKTKKGGR